MRIIYMGTPYFAVPPLEKLIREGYQPVAVVTAPDKPAGRGLKLKTSAVKDVALRNGIPVLQPNNLKDPHFLDQLKSFQPDLQFVVAFRMLPEQVWNLPPLGTYNLHASLLPDYRGAAPINHAIIQGEMQSGLTTFKLRHEIDTGDIAFQVSIPIGPDQTAGELHDEMLPEGAELVLKTIRALESGTLQLKQQQNSSVFSGIKTAPKLSPAYCKIHFSDSTIHVHNKIRGLSPHPGGMAQLHQDGRLMDFKLLRSKVSSISRLGNPGEIFILDRDHIYVCCADGWIEILELQPAGKKRMTSREFLNGFIAGKNLFFD